MLETAYASPSTTRMLNLLLSLQDLKQNDDSITDYLYKAKTISDQLAAAGRPVSAGDFNCIIFKGLRHKFHTIIPTLAATKTPISFMDLLSALLNHEMLVHNFSDSFIHNVEVDVIRNPKASANLAQKRQSSRSYSGYSIGPNYNNRNNSSRPHNNNRQRNNSGPRRNNYNNNNNNRSSPNQSVQCQICHRFNHTTDSCRQRYNHAHPPNANTTSFYQNSFTDAWFLDTSATHHVTPDLQSLDHSTPYTGSDTLRVGNGSHNEESVADRTQ